MAEEPQDTNQQALKTEDEVYEEAARSTADYANPKPLKEPNPVWRKLGIALAALAAVTIVAGAIYWLAAGRGANKKPEQQPQGQNTQAASSKITTATKHYDSSNFNLGFDYPADWTVSDTGNGPLTVKSPPISLKDSDGQSTDTQITMTIRTNTDKLAEFDSGNAIASLNSEKIAYTQPTQAQRANTYLSFPRYAGTSGGMSGVYVTGDNGYKVAQAIPKVDIQKSQPVISVTFTSSVDKSQLNLSTDNWSEAAFSEPIKNMIESLAIN